MNERKVFPIIFEYIIFFVVVWRSLSIYTIFVHKKSLMLLIIYTCTYIKDCVYTKNQKNSLTKVAIIVVSCFLIIYGTIKCNQILNGIHRLHMYTNKNDHKVTSWFNLKIFVIQQCIVYECLYAN